METIRAYTTLEQSRKLAEILPLESADMYYLHDIPYAIPYKNRIDVAKPCWSLAALLDILPEYNLQKICCGNIKVGDRIVIYPDDEHYISDYYDNPVDTCYEMIIKLHKQNLL